MTKKHGRDAQPAADQAPTASPSTKKQRLTDIEAAAPAAEAAAVTADPTPEDFITVACGDARGRYSSSKGMIVVDSSEQQGSWVSRADFVNKLGGRGSHDYLKAIKVVAEDGSSLGQLGKYLKGHSVTPARPSKQQQGKQEQTGDEQGGDAYEFPPDGEAEKTAAAEGEAGTANGKAKGGAKAAAGAQGGSGSSRRRSSAAAAAAAAAPASAEPRSGRRSSKAAAAAAAAEEEQAPAPAAAGGSGGSSGGAATKRGRRSSAAKAMDNAPAAAATDAAAGSGGKGRASAAKGRRSKAAAATADADGAPAEAAVEEEGVGAATDGMADDTEPAAAAADVEPVSAADDQPAAEPAATAASGPSKAQQKKHGRARRQKLSSAATWDGLEGGTSTAAAAEAAATAAAGGEEGAVDRLGAGAVQDGAAAGVEQGQEEEAELDANMQGVFPAVQQPEDESLVSLMNGPDVGAGPVGDAVGQGGDGHDQFGAGLQYDWASGGEEAGAAAAGAEGEQQQEEGVEGQAAASAAGEEGVEGAAGVGEGEAATAAAAAAAAEEQAAEQGDAAAAAAAAMEVDTPTELTAAAPAAAAPAAAAGGGSITFAELRVQLLQPAAQAGLDQLWGVAQQVYGPSASAAAVRVAPILQIYADEAILGDSRECFMAGEESHRQQAVQRLTALQQLLSEPAMGGEGVLQQGQHEVLCAGVDGLLADFAAVGAADGSG